MCLYFFKNIGSDAPLSSHGKFDCSATTLEFVSHHLSRVIPFWVSFILYHFFGLYFAHGLGVCPT